MAGPRSHIAGKSQTLESDLLTRAHLARVSFKLTLERGTSWPGGGASQIKGEAQAKACCERDVMVSSGIRKQCRMHPEGQKLAPIGKSWSMR